MSFGNHIIQLNDTREMPLLGLGAYKTLDDTELKQGILEAFSCGYHLIDTASFYKNEEGIGRAIKALSIPRSELFITTKLWNTAQRIGNIEDSFYRSLERLGLDYLDLYLIHWPVPGCFCNTWQVFEKLQSSGVIKSIGVSNFSIHDLELLKEASDITPAVNQIEMHPLFQNPELISYCQTNGSAIQAYAPLARGAYANSPLMIEIGKQHQKTPAQIGLRWLVQQNISVIPKSGQKNHIEENSKIFDFSLTEEEMSAISAMNTGQRITGVPEDMVPYL